MMIKKHDILEKIASLCRELTRKHYIPMGNLQVIEALFDKWFGDTDNRNTDVPVCPSTYVRAKKTDCNQSVFSIAEDSFHRLLEVSEWHARQCKDSTKILKKGHVVKTNLKCRNEDKPHIFSWLSSPYLPSKEYLVNSRVNHGLICSGIFPSDYKRFANGAGIGIINEENRTTFFKQHKQHIQQECNDSIETALLEEVASYEDLETIDMTDARHGWRKNAKDTSVVAIGEKTHKVLKCEHVAKTDDLVTQRHEKIGTERIYSYMDEHDTKIGIHCHDRNLFINKFIRESTDSVNQNDTWHCVKAMKIP
jgi:hypothetical protein